MMSNDCNRHHHPSSSPGFQEEYGTIKVFLLETKKTVTLIAEFGAARARLVVLVSKGELGLRLRGNKKDTVKDMFQQLRKSVLESLQSSATIDRSKYTAMTTDRYKSKTGRSAADDGKSTEWRWHKGVLQECVLLAQQHEDEWEVEVLDEDRVQKRSVLDDGKGLLRENQQAKKMESLRSKLTGNVTSMSMGKSYKSDDEESSDSSSSSSSSEDDSDHDSIMDDEGSDDDVPKLLSRTLKTVPKAKVSKAKPAKPNTVAKLAGSASSGKAKAPSPKKPKQVPQARPPSPKATRKRESNAPSSASKARRSDTVAEVDDSETCDSSIYLQRNGATELEARFIAFLGKVAGASELQDLKADPKLFSGAFKSLTDEAQKLNKEAIALFWKIRKRKAVPQEVIDLLNKLRDRVAAAMTMLMTFAVKHADENIDLEKVRRPLATIKMQTFKPTYLNFELPAKFGLIKYRATADEKFAFSQFDDLHNHLSVPARSSPSQPYPLST